MVIRWENEDLTELTKKLLPAYIELASAAGEKISFLLDTADSIEQIEAVCCIMMTFFLNNNQCSLIIIKEDDDYINALNYYGFQIITKTYEKEIVLSYKELPDNFIQDGL